MRGLLVGHLLPPSPKCRAPWKMPEKLLRAEASELCWELPGLQLCPAPWGWLQDEAWPGGPACTVAERQTFPTQASHPASHPFTRRWNFPVLLWI